MELKAKVTKKGGLFTADHKKAVVSNLDASMYNAVMLLERGVKLRTPRGVMGSAGGLVSGIHGEVIGKGSLAIKGIVASHPTHGYAEVIEKGRTPGKAMPPKGVLVRWIEKKFHVSEDRAQKLEFVVRRAIGRRGFKSIPSGAKMFEKSLDMYMPLIQKEFERCGYNITRELGGK